MTAAELRRLFNNEFGLGSWPKTYEVDHETYANVCQAFFSWAIKNENDELVWIEDGKVLIKVALGPNFGIMFKNVELILANDDELATTIIA